MEEINKENYAKIDKKKERRRTIQRREDLTLSKMADR